MGPTMSCPDKTEQDENHLGAMPVAPVPRCHGRLFTGEQDQSCGGSGDHTGEIRSHTAVRTGERRSGTVGDRSRPGRADPPRALRRTGRHAARSQELAGAVAEMKQGPAHLGEPPSSREPARGIEPLTFRLQGECSAN